MADILDSNNRREKRWYAEDIFDNAKDRVVVILKENNASLSMTRTLFNQILNEIEDRNPVTMN